MLKESEIRIIKVIWKQSKLERVNDLEQSLEIDIQELPDVMQESVLKESSQFVAFSTQQPCRSAEAAESERHILGLQSFLPMLTSEKSKGAL